MIFDAFGEGERIARDQMKDIEKEKPKKSSIEEDDLNKITGHNVSTALRLEPVLRDTTDRVKELEIMMVTLMTDA